jgi:hypothetical protein
MEVKGTIKHIGDLQKVSDKFQKQDIVLVLDAETKYPQLVQFQVTQANCIKLASLKIGDEVKAQFNLKGREWNGGKGTQYFNTLEIWQISKEGKAEPKQQSESGAANDNDDLPF